MRVFAAGMVCLALAGCDSPNFRTSQFQFGSAQTLAATGNLRFASQPSSSAEGMTGPGLRQV
jgi:hypothetical protein